MSVEYFEVLDQLFRDTGEYHYNLYNEQDVATLHITDPQVVIDLIAANTRSTVYFLTKTYRSEFWITSNRVSAIDRWHSEAPVQGAFRIQELIDAQAT